MDPAKREVSAQTEVKMIISSILVTHDSLTLLHHRIQQKNFFTTPYIFM